MALYCSKYQTIISLKYYIFVLMVTNLNFFRCSENFENMDLKKSFEVF